MAPFLTATDTAPPVIGVSHAGRRDVGGRYANADVLTGSLNYKSRSPYGPAWMGAGSVCFTAGEICGDQQAAFERFQFQTGARVR
jgi:hypothetical protein